jgi:hypothetical protein
VQYRLRTLLFLIAGTVPPIYAGCEAWKVGCLVDIALIWSGLVAAPLLMMGLFSRMTSSEDARDRLIGCFGLIAAAGYLYSICLSIFVIGHHRPWLL